MMSFRPNELLAEHKSVFKQVPQRDVVDPAHVNAFWGQENDTLSPSADQLVA
jgi:hypothetical protein